MDSKEELRQLRRDLDDVMTRASRISRRLDEIESQALKKAVQGDVAPRIVEEVPPPIPTSFETSEAEREQEPASIPTPPVFVTRPRSAESPPIQPAPPTTVEVWASSLSDKVQALIQGQIDKFQAQVKEVGWEVVLGKYWLPRVAMVCISIAVVFFLSLAVERWGREWMPHLRVGIGYVVTAALLLAAWRSEKQYPDFSRVVYGGSFAVMYFVSFATHYVKYARIFDSPTPTLVLLAAIVLTWTVAAELRKSKAVAVMVAVLGHFTVLLSTLTLHNPGPTATLGILALSAGSAFFLLRNRWYQVASIGLLGAYANDFMVLVKGRGTDPLWDFIGAMAALTVLFLVFSLSELFAPEETRRKTMPTWFRTAYVSFNTAAFLILGTVLMGEFDFTRGHQDIFRFVTAAALFLIGIGYLRLRASDPLFNTYIVKAVAVGTAGLAACYGGNTLTACLATETVVLLYSSRRSGLVVMRVLSMIVACIALLHAVIMTGQPLNPDKMFGNTTDGIAIVLSFLLAAFLHERTDWAPRSPGTVFLPTSFLRVCWMLNLVNDNPDGTGERPLKGQLAAHLYAVAGGICYLVYVRMVVDAGDRYAAVACFGVVMTVLAYVLNSLPFGALSLGMTTIAAVTCLAELHNSVPFSPWLTVLGLASVVAVALTTESRRIGLQRGLDYHHNEWSPYLLYGLAALQIGMVCCERLTYLSTGYALISLALGTAALMLVLHPRALSGISVAFSVWSGFWCMIRVAQFSNVQIFDNRWRFLIFTVIAGLLLLDRFNTYYRDRAPTTALGSIVGIIGSMLVLWVYSWCDLHEGWAVAVALGCYGLCAYGVAFRTPVAFATSVATVLLASIVLSGSTFDAKQYHEVMPFGFILLCAFWIGLERAMTIHQSVTESWAVKLRDSGNVDIVESNYRIVPVILGAFLLIVMVASIVGLTHSSPAYITMSWFGIAAACFMFSLVFEQKNYRLVGLAVILLSLGRLFLIDMAEQDPLFRVAAFAVVGMGLLAISIGYYKGMHTKSDEAEAEAESKDPDTSEPPEE